METDIHLRKHELNWCQKHAEDIVNHYGGDGSGGSGSYAHNKISSNMVGVKCEVGTAIFLKKHFDNNIIHRNYEDFKNKKLKGDIEINGHILEVKGLQPHQWDKFKRCIPPNQLKHYVSENAIVIWATAAGNKRNRRVKIYGWNYATDVDEKGIFRQTICANIWLKDDADMRDMTELIEVLNR